MIAAWHNGVSVKLKSGANRLPANTPAATPVYQASACLLGRGAGSSRPAHLPLLNSAMKSNLLSLLLALAAPTTALAVPVLPDTDLAHWACTGACGSSAPQGDVGASPAGSARYAYVTTWGSASVGVSPLALPGNSRGNGTETNGSRLASPSFNAAAGDTLSLHFSYVSTDGKGFDDYAWARLVDAGTGNVAAWLFTARSSNSSTGNIVPGDVLDRDDFDPREVIVDYKNFEFTSKTVDNPVDWAPLGLSNGTCWRDNAAGCGTTGWLNSRITLAQGGSFRVEFGVVNWGDEAFDSGLAFDMAGLQAAAPVPEPASWALALLGVGVLIGRRRR